MHIKKPRVQEDMLSFLFCLSSARIRPLNEALAVIRLVTERVIVDVQMLGSKLHLSFNWCILHLENYSKFSARMIIILPF